MVDDQEQLRQHWQELAEQLGLDGPEPPGAAPESKRDEPGHASVTEVEKTEPQPVPGAGQKRQAGDDPAHFAVGDTLPAVSKASAADQFVAISETSGDEPPPGSPERPIADDSRRGRRGRRPEKNERDRPRRRRDSSSRPRDEVFLSQAEPEIDKDSSEMNDPADFAETEFPEEIEAGSDEDSAGPERKEEEDLEDVDVLSDWNVPSWAELIASLYRPDR